jgi:peptidoglycan/LPS O-acetylase OafA/YrhL
MKILKIKLESNRVYGLDILRALAIIFVVLGHTENILPDSKFKIIEFFLFDGVGVFFVLSGFLIGGILLKILNKGDFTYVKLKNFWLRRWIRTLPNYFLILTILIILNLLFTKGFSVKEYISYFFFTQNLFYEHPLFFTEAWSLSVEEWFYLIVPFSLFVLGLYRKSVLKKNLLITIGVIVLSVTFYRYFKFVNLNETGNYGLLFARQVFTRLDSLMYGLVGAYVNFYYKDFWLKNRYFFLVLAICFLLLYKYIEIFAFTPFYYCVISFSLTSIITLFFLPFLSNLKDGSGFIYKTITYISLTSYSIYLVNFSIVKFWILPNINLYFLYEINGYLHLSIRLLIYWGITFLISIILYKYFEIPTTKLRDKFTRKTNE